MDEEEEFPLKERPGWIDEDRYELTVVAITMELFYDQVMATAEFMNKSRGKVETSKYAEILLLTMLDFVRYRQKKQKE